MARRKTDVRDVQFESIFTYNSCHYENEYGANFDSPASMVSSNEAERTFSDRLLEGACTVLSSIFLLLTLPFTLPFSLRFVRPSERLVVMRLGRTKGVRGPGTVLVLPWVDKATRFDLRTTSLRLPAIQSITDDRGIIDLTAVLFFQIIDPLVAHCAMKNVSETLHSLAYTTLSRQICKRMLSDLTNPASLLKLLTKCQDELNEFVRHRGAQVERISVTRLEVLRAADCSAVSVFQTLARSEFAKQLFGQFRIHMQSPLSSTSSGVIPTTPEVIFGRANKGVNAQQMQPDTTDDCERQEPLLVPDPHMVKLLDQIRAVLSPQLVQRVQRLFRIHCDVANHEIDIDLRSNAGWCGWTRERIIAPTPDVLFTLDKGTLLALLDGSVSPLSAYLDGRVQIRGSMHDAILLKHLAEAVSATMKNTEHFDLNNTNN